MAKIYFKTILMTAAFAFLLFLRLKLLNISVDLPNPFLEFILASLVVAIIINEKLTKGEHWTKGHMLLLVFLMFLIFFIILRIYAM